MAHSFQEGAFVNEAVRDRQQMSAKQLRKDREVAERRARAWRAAFDGFPELRCGTEQNPDDKRHPCPWLVAAICNVSAKGPVKRGAVLAERKRLMPRSEINEEREAA
jgi:hypothetical protein